MTTNLDDKSFLSQLRKALNSLMLGDEEKEIEQTVEKSAVVENTLGNAPIVLKAIDMEQRVCTEIVYKPIVKDLHGEWMSPETIESAEQSFRTNLEKGLVTANLFHVTPTNKFTIKKSWVLPQDTLFEGKEESVVKGTWLVETHYNDDQLWEMKKSGKLGGLSLGGFGSTNKLTGEITSLFFSNEEFKDSITKLKKGDK